MMPQPLDPTTVLFHARAVRREAAAIRAESRVLRGKMHEQYERSRYLKAVTREVLYMVRVTEPVRGD